MQPTIETECNLKFHYDSHPDIQTLKGQQIQPAATTTTKAGKLFYFLYYCILSPGCNIDFSILFSTFVHYCKPGKSSRKPKPNNHQFQLHTKQRQPSTKKVFLWQRKNGKINWIWKNYVVIFRWKWTFYIIVWKMLLPGRQPFTYFLFFFSAGAAISFENSNVFFSFFPFKDEQKDDVE